MAKQKKEIDETAGVDAKSPPPKAKCAVTKAQFLENAKPILVTFGSGETAEKKVMGLKEFSTGSFGYYLNDKITVMIDGAPCKVQLSINAILVGSKEAAAE